MSFSTTGFLDALANHVAGIGLSLTKGTNLFAANELDDPDAVTDAVLLFDRGYTSRVDLDILYLTWSVDVWTSRKTRIAALDAVKSVQDQVLRKRFRITSDSNEMFQVLTVRVADPGSVLTEKLDSGRYLAESSLEFEVIPG